MKNFPLILMLLLSTIKGMGQTSNEVSKYFYDLPIDSCQGYIMDIINREKLVNSEFSPANGYRVNKDLLANSNSIDSVMLQIGCFEVAIGGNPDQIAPMAYEQWLISSTYFTDSSSAEMTFKRLKSELDTFVEEPYLNKKTIVIEWVYSLETNVGNIHSKQIHLVYDSEAK